MSKLGQVKKKSQKVEEVSLQFGKRRLIVPQYESEVVAARRAHTSASLDVALVLNETLAKKRFEFLERIEVYMHAQMHYFHQGFECFKDLEPSMNSYAKNLQAVCFTTTTVIMRPVVTAQGIIIIVDFLFPFFKLPRA